MKLCFKKQKKKKLQKENFVEKIADGLDGIGDQSKGLGRLGPNVTAVLLRRRERKRERESE